MNVFKSGSVGQVHRCKYNGKDAIVKIQYVGLKEQFDSDIRILDLVSSYLFYFMDLSSILLEIKSKLYEELDFITEYENQQTFYELWKDHEYIHVPKLIPDVSSKTMIAMEFVDGVVLGNFISTATQEERNHIGKLLVEFVFTNLFKHGLLYPDIHFGNFIVKHDDPSSSLPHIFVTDFGCLSRLSGKLISTLKHILRNIRNCDADSFFESAKELGIVSEGITDESREYMYEYFKLQLEPLTVDTFRFTQEWLTRAVYKKTELMKNWILPPECIYLNKIPYGLYHLLTSLELEGNFWEMMLRLIEDDLQHP
jgi:predicted unusual protein kinase regulating ubiquinone biosynthesis (AarF/ABC1/UbiB family)